MGRGLLSEGACERAWKRDAARRIFASCHHLGELSGIAGPSARVRCRSRASRSEAHQHIICRAAELERADAHPPILLGSRMPSQKKIDNHAHSVALFAMSYNFVRIHKTLRTTPAMAAGVSKRPWEMADVVDVLEAWENSAH